MTLTLTKPTGALPRYGVRIARSEGDIRAAQRLRHLAFRGQAAGQKRDCDSFDELCTHVLVEDAATNRLVCCFRLLALPNGAALRHSYAAQFYDLAALSRHAGPMLELGRFCMHPKEHDPNILRAAWSALTRYVDDAGVEMLFGCSSFHGTDAAPYRDALALLRAQHLAPQDRAPCIGAPEVVRFAQTLNTTVPDKKRAQQQMPPLLRTYLLMGGWVSDHAVVDRDMNTLHVFTGLEIHAIPEARKRLLRATAEVLDGASARG